MNRKTRNIVGLGLVLLGAEVATRGGVSGAVSGLVNAVQDPRLWVALREAKHGV